MKWGPQAFGTSSLPRGTRINTLVGVQDLFATLAELTGTPVAGDQGRDSFSMLRVLMGEATAIRGHMVHEADFDAPGETTVGGESRIAVATGNWFSTATGCPWVFMTSRMIRLKPPTSCHSRNKIAGQPECGLASRSLGQRQNRAPVGTALVTVPDVTDLSQAARRKRYPRCRSGYRHRDPARQLDRARRERH